MRKIIAVALALAGVFGAGARRMPAEIKDTALYNKVMNVLDAVDELDDMNLYGNVTMDLYRAYKGSDVGDYLAKQCLRFGTPSQVRVVLSDMPARLRESDEVKALIARAEARERTAAGTQYVDVKGYDAAGKPATLSQYVKPGRYTLVDFWASWCPWCIKEIPNLKEQLSKYSSKGLDIVGVAVRDEPDATAGMVAKKGIAWPVLYNTGMGAYDSYGFAGIPHHILIGPDGKIVFNGCSVAQVSEYIDGHPL